MRPIHQHEIDPITRADLAIAYTALAFFLTLSWLLPAAGVWGILLPPAAPPPTRCCSGGLAYAVVFVGWMSWVGVAATAV